MTGLILLTGASGFVGSVFLKYALGKGLRVRALTRRYGKLPSHEGLEVIEGDLLSQYDWSDVLKDVECVVHAAAELKDPTLMNSVNVLGAERLLQAAVNVGVKRWVQLSSVGSYGLVLNGLVNEEWCDNPASRYEVSKSNFDCRLKQASRDNEIEVCIVRPSNVYGAGMSNQSIQLMLSVIRKNLFVFIGLEGASANYIHVNDVVRALDLCVRHPKAANQIYIVSAWATIEDMVSGLVEGAGLTSPSRRISVAAANLLANAMQWLPYFPLTLKRVHALSSRCRYSTNKIEKELGWRPTVPVRDGMREFARNLH